MSIQIKDKRKGERLVKQLQKPHNDQTMKSSPGALDRVEKLERKVQSHEKRIKTLENQIFYLYALEKTKANCLKG